MQKTGLRWDPIKTRRAPDVPKAFEPTLKSILQQKYLNEGLSLPEIQEYIESHHDLFIGSRQITHRLNKYCLLKRNHQARPQPSQDSREAPARSAYSVAPAAPENRSSTTLNLKHFPANDSNRFLESRSSDTDGCLELSHTAGLMYDLELTENLNPTDLAMLPEFDIEGGDSGTTAGNDASDPAIEAKNAPSTELEQVSPDKHRNEEVDQPDASWTSPRYPDIFTNVSQITKTPDETAKILCQIPDDDEFSFYRRQHDGDLTFFKGMVAETTDGAIASMPVSVERVGAILRTLFQNASWYPGLMELSVLEVRACMRLALVVLCCGRDDDAFHCFEFLLWCWSTGNITASETIATIDQFTCSVNTLTWLLQTKACNKTDGVCFELWKSVWNAQTDRSEQRSDNHAFTVQQVLAVGRLALVAYSQNYKVLFEALCRLWKVHGGATLARELETTAQSPQRATVEYIDSKITDPQSMSIIRQSTIHKYDKITLRIGWLLRWIRVQLLLYATSVNREGINSEEMWRRIYPRQTIERLEQQMLLSYLSHQGSQENLQWTPLLTKKDCERLPWSISLEWLLGEVPLLTFSALSSLIKGKDNHTSDIMASEMWYKRMLAAFDLLLDDVTGTTARFLVVVGAIDSLTVSGETLQGLTHHPVGTAALFSGAVSRTLQEHVSAQDFGYHDPTLLNTPRSSLSGLASMKSVWMRTKGHVKRKSTSLSTCSSLCWRRLNRSESSLTHNLLGSPMSMSQESLKGSSWLPVRGGREDEKPLISTKKEATDLETMDLDDVDMRL